MSFFTPDDYMEIYGHNERVAAALISNAKLERDGILMGYINNTWIEMFTKDRSKIKAPYTATAFRVAVEDIEPIEKCDHPEKKIRITYLNQGNRTELERIYECECGARVKPKEFEVCE